MIISGGIDDIKANLKEWRKLDKSGALSSEIALQAEAAGYDPLYLIGCLNAKRVTKKLTLGDLMHLKNCADSVKKAAETALDKA